MSQSTTRNRNLLARHILLAGAVLAFLVAVVTWLWFPTPMVKGPAALLACIGFSLTLLLDVRAKRSLESPGR